MTTLPNNATKHETKDFIAHTIPADGFEKLIAYSRPGLSWTHKDYRKKPKKSRKKGLTKHSKRV